MGTAKCKLQNEGCTAKCRGAFFILQFSFLILHCIYPPSSTAQYVERLPPVVPLESPFSRYVDPPRIAPLARPPARLAMSADPNIQQSVPQNEPESQPPIVPQLPPGAKPGVLQRVKFINTFLGGTSG